MNTFNQKPDTSPAKDGDTTQPAKARNTGRQDVHQVTDKDVIKKSYSAPAKDDPKASPTAAKGSDDLMSEPKQS